MLTRPKAKASSHWSQAKAKAKHHWLSSGLLCIRGSGMRSGSLPDQWEVIRGESPGNEKQNRCSLRYCLNPVNDEAELTCSGSVFQMRAPDLLTYSLLLRRCCLGDTNYIQPATVSHKRSTEVFFGDVLRHPLKPGVIPDNSCRLNEIQQW